MYNLGFLVLLGRLCVDNEDLYDSLAQPDNYLPSTLKVKPKPPLDPKEFFWVTFSLYRQVLIETIDIVSSYTTFPAKNKK